MTAWLHWLTWLQLLHARWRYVDGHACVGVSDLCSFSRSSSMSLIYWLEGGEGASMSSLVAAAVVAVCCACAQGSP